MVTIDSLQEFIALSYGTIIDPLRRTV